MEMTSKALKMQLTFLLIHILCTAASALTESSNTEVVLPSSPRRNSNNDANLVSSPMNGASSSIHRELFNSFINLATKSVEVTAKAKASIPAESVQATAKAKAPSTGKTNKAAGKGKAEPGNRRLQRNQQIKPPIRGSLAQAKEIRVKRRPKKTILKRTQRKSRH